MGALKFFLVSYDITDAKRLREVRKTVEGFGNRLQYSVFRCDLTPQGKIELQARLDGIINHTEDTVMIVDLGPVDGNCEKRVVFMGRHPPDSDRGAIII